jgi:NAD(P)-dependent dehydrogenase (short-subunit alcohol dehydrogenase family)
MAERKSPTRREFVAGSAGLLAAPAVFGAERPSSAQDRPSNQSMNAQNQQPLSDPREGYPKPPFEKQPQDPPGLASKMVPRPDHGEKSYKGSGKLVGRKALVTGGDSGIGRAAAIAFAREGADVAICYLPVEEPDAKEVIDLIKAEGRKAIALPGDIRDEKFCQKLVADAVAGLGGLDLLVNNAAKQHSVDAIADVTTEQFDATFKTNVYAMFWITKAAIPHMPAGSAIINTSSVQAFSPSPNLLDYAQTKACIVVFTKIMAKQLAQKGIRVNAVAPGPIWTPLQPSGGQPQDKLVDFGKSTPLGRPGQPAELAPTYVLLASKEASYTTGEVYGDTGGTSPY